MSGARRSPAEIFVIAAIVVLAGWLRLTDLGLVEYKADEAMAIDLTLPLVEGRGWVTAGLVSSVGVRNPPMLMYLLAVPLAIDVDPLAAVAFVGLLATAAVLGTYLVARPRFGPFAALTAAALFATAPWAVFLGRKIWAQDLLPIFCVALLAGLFVVLERPRSRWIAAVPPLACALCQLHLSAIALLPPIALVILYAARRIHLAALACGAAAAVAMTLPYVSYQATHGWEDLQRARAALHHQEGVERRPLLQPLVYAAEVTGALGWSYVTGDSHKPFVRAARTMNAAASAASVFAIVLLAIGVGAAGRQVAAGLRRVGWRGRLTAPEERAAVLLLWLGGICAALVAGRLAAYPHYFVVAYPVPFLLIALGLDAVRGAAPAGWRPRLAAGLVAAACAAYVAFDVGFLRFLDAAGGTAGDYGTVYRYKNEVAWYAQRHGFTLDGASEEIEQLARLRQRYPRPAPAKGLDVAPPGHVLEVRDQMPDIAGCARELRRRFGPITTCLDR